MTKVNSDGAGVVYCRQAFQGECLISSSGDKLKREPARRAALCAKQCYYVTEQCAATKMDALASAFMCFGIRICLCLFVIVRPVFVLL